MLQTYPESHTTVLHCDAGSARGHGLPACVATPSRGYLSPGSAFTIPGGQATRCGVTVRAGTTTPPNVGAYRATRPVVSRWSIEHPIALGGFGEVWQARDRRGRAAALKVLRADRASDTECRRLFLTEAGVLRQLRLPGVPALLDCDRTIDGRPFVVMEFVPGQTLAAAVQNAIADTPEETVRRLTKHVLAAARIVERAHGQGILHLDLKPQNILISDQGETFVIDWGGALSDSRKPASSTPTTFAKGPTIGTPGYLSPERRQSFWSPSALDDVFSLGVTLQAIAASRSGVRDGPGGDSMDADVKQRAKCEFEQRLLAVAARATHSTRRDRTPTVRALVVELERALAGRDDTAG